MSRSLLICLASVCLAARSSAEDWPRWRGPHGDGHWGGPKLAEKFPVNGLRKVWQRSIGGGYGGVAATGGRVFVLDRQKEPTDVERLVCLDAKTGEEHWVVQYEVAYGDLSYGNGPRSAPTIVDGLVYTAGAFGHVHCVNVTDGSIKWSRDFSAAVKKRFPMWALAASPVVVGDLVIVVLGAENDGGVIALDRLTGKEKWRALDEAAGYATPLVIKRSGRQELVVWMANNICGLATATGDVLWKVPYKVTYGVAIAMPIYQEGIVFVAGYWEGSKAIKLGESPHDAELLYEENKFLRGLMSQPLYRDGQAYLIDKRFGLTCFELKTGKKLWDAGNKLTPRGRNPQATIVWLNGMDRFLALNSEGELVHGELSTAGYKEFDRTKIIDKTWAHPAYFNHFVCARNDSTIVCYSLTESAEVSVPEREPDTQKQ